MAKKVQKILLVQNPSSDPSALARCFVSAGYQVRTESNGSRVLAMIKEEEPQLLVSDLDLPGENGLTITKLSRKFYSGGIILLSERTEELDQVLALEMGADDMLPRQASERLILARAQALLRRLTVFNAQLAREASQRLEFGRLQIDASVRDAWLEGQSIDLTSAEFDLLWLLASQAGQVVTREAIFHQLRGIEYDGQDRSIDVRISRIRPKIGDDPISPKIIKTVRAKGYLFSPKYFD